MIKTWTGVAGAAAFVLTLSCMPASAQLLGNLLGEGGVGEVVTSVTETVNSVVEGGGGGVLENVLEVDPSGNGSIGVPGVATVTVNTSGEVPKVGVTVMGGGGESISIPVGGGGAGVELPGVGNLIGVLPDLPDLPGLPGLPDLPGLPGLPGQQGQAGLPGSNGSNGAKGANGANGVVFNSTVGVAALGGNPGIRGGTSLEGINGLSNSSRLKLLLSVLQNRAWLRFAQGNKLCLANFGVANAASYVGQNERAALQQLIAAFGADIQTLQQMMRRCRNGQNRLVDISRVIGVDLRPDGQIVVMTI